MNYPNIDSNLHRIEDSICVSPMPQSDLKYTAIDPFEWLSSISFFSFYCDR